LKKTIESEINEFLDLWNFKEMSSFLSDIIHLLHLYDVDEQDDWVREAVGGSEENVQTVRLIRTVYLLSKIADKHASKLCKVNVHFKNLWKRLEQFEKDKL